MANSNFTFAHFSDFTKRADFDELMRQFQLSQAHHEEATKERDRVKLAFQQWQEYLDLCTDYRDLFSSMMKKLLDAKTGSEIEKIRANYSNKLVPIMQKLDLIQQKISGVLTAAEITSRNSITDKIAQVKNLLEQATSLKNETMPLEEGE